jgi:hypothetical protein
VRARVDVLAIQHMEPRHDLLARETQRERLITVGVDIDPLNRAPGGEALIVGDLTSAEW